MTRSTDAAAVLDLLRVFSFLSQDEVPVTGAFAVGPARAATAHSA